jgi:hypothetical protein
MTYFIQKFTQGIWVNMSQHTSKELAEAEIGIQRSIRIDGRPTGHYRILEVES